MFKVPSQSGFCDLIRMWYLGSMPIIDNNNDLKQVV